MEPNPKKTLFTYPPNLFAVDPNGSQIIQGMQLSQESVLSMFSTSVYVPDGVDKEMCLPFSQEKDWGLPRIETLEVLKGMNLLEGNQQNVEPNQPNEDADPEGNKDTEVFAPRKMKRKKRKPAKSEEERVARKRERNCVLARESRARKKEKLIEIQKDLAIAKREALVLKQKSSDQEKVISDQEKVISDQAKEISEAKREAFLLKQKNSDQEREIERLRKLLEEKNK